MSWYNALNSLFTGKNSEKRSGGPVYPGANDIYAQMALSAQSKSGQAVNDRTIMGIPAMFRAINVIAGTMAAMESGVLRRTSNGVELGTGHPVFNLFVGRPHQYYTKYDFIHALITNACLGNGYARIHWGPDGRPYALEILPSEGVWQEWLTSGEMVYRVTTILGGKPASLILPSSDVIHLKGFSTYDGVTGRRISLIHKEVLGSALAANDFSSEYFSNGVHIPGFLSRPEIIGVDEAEAIQRKVSNAKGVANAGGLPFFDGGMKFERVGQTMQEAALVDFRKYTVEECSRITGVPLHMLSENSRSTFTNMEQQSADYVTHCVNHWAVKAEEEFTTKLFTPSEIRGRRYFYNFNVESMIRGDTEAIAKMIAAVIPNSIMTPNEVRARFFNMNSIEGGNELLAQVNMTLLKKLGETPETEDGEQTNDQEDDKPEPAIAN